ncbi:MAG: hypothetical protein ACTSXD_12385 [Candidatus Heimdallarchaeaceae archaeon]
MAMWKCPNCKIVLCDVDIYYRAPGEKRRNLRMKILCPNCQKISTLEEWRLDRCIKNEEKKF